jgi:hypothetical protein
MHVPMYIPINHEPFLRNIAALSLFRPASQQVDLLHLQGHSLKGKT